MKNEASINKRRTTIDKCFTHPVIQIFLNPKVKEYFEKENKKTLEFGDLQFLLCRKKPKKEMWKKRWKNYFLMVNGTTGKEVYNSKEHLHKEIRKHLERFPGILDHIDHAYALSPNSINQAMRDFTLSKLNNNSDVLILNNAIFFGLDSKVFDEKESELFDTYFNHIYKPLRAISEKMEMLRHLWLRLQLKKYLTKIEQISQDIPQKDRGDFIGYEHEHFKWFIQSCDANLNDFQEFYERFREWGLSQGQEVWDGAEAYFMNIQTILKKHQKEIGKYLQREFKVSLLKDTHFKVMSRALKNMVDSDIISRNEYKWLRTQQRMSKIHLEKLGEDLTSRTLDKMPLIVVDSS